MARKQTLIHLHGTTRLENASLLNKGEIAVRHAETKEDTELAVKTTVKVEGSDTDVLVYIPSLDKVTGAIAATDTAAQGYANKAQSDAEATAKEYTEARELILQGQIDDLVAKVGEGFTTGSTVADQIQAAVAAEAEIARNAEKALGEEIETHTSNNDIHVTAEQKEAWQDATDAINAFMDAENVGTDVIDTLKEIQEYINNDGAAADLMAKNIKDNADAIDAIEADYLTSEDKNALQKQINDIAGEGGSLAGTLQAAKDYTDGLLGEGFTTGNTVTAAIKAITDDYLTSEDKDALVLQIGGRVEQSVYNAKVAELVAQDNAFTEALNAAKTRIKNLEDADYVKEVSVKNSGKNNITAREVEGVVTLDFDDMVIDCGEYE